MDLRYDAAEDLVLARLVAAVTVDERLLDDHLYVGFDSAGDDARCTTVCLVGFASDPSGRAAHLARLVLGERVWAQAMALAMQGSGGHTVILDRHEASSLIAAWSAFRGEVPPAAHPYAGATASTDGVFTVDVISVSDSELHEVLARWSAEMETVDRPRRSHRGRLPSALRRGIGGLRAAGERAGGTLDRTIGGEWDRPDLPDIGVDPRLARQVEPGNPPVLVIRAAQIRSRADVQADARRRIEVQLGNRRTKRTTFRSDEVGAFAARVPLPVDPMSTARELHTQDPASHTRAPHAGRRLLLRGVRRVRRVMPRWARPG